MQAAGNGERAHQAKRTVEVEQIVVRELLAVQQARGRQVGAAIVSGST